MLALNRMIRAVTACCIRQRRTTPCGCLALLRPAVSAHNAIEFRIEPERSVSRCTENHGTNGPQMKRIGIDAWIQEQEERRRTGSACVDIRREPYEVPQE